MRGQLWLLHEQGGPPASGSITLLGGAPSPTPIWTSSGFLTVTDLNDFNGPAQTTNLGQRTQIAAQQRTIAWISTTANAAIAVLIYSRESGFCLKIRSRLEQMGFRIEAGVRCQQGLVLSAYRHGFGQMENAA